MFGADDIGSLAWFAAAPVGALLLWAAAAKLGAPAVWREQARGLGAPSWSIPLVPGLEAFLGGLLVSGLVAPVARLATIALVLAFTGLLARRLVAGARPPCACFGGRSRPISWWSIGRNGVLVALLLVALLVG